MRELTKKMRRNTNSPRTVTRAKNTAYSYARASPAVCLTPFTTAAIMPSSGMDHVVNMMAAMSDGPVCAVVTCCQLNSGNTPARCGTRAVRATAASIAGMTADPVHFVSCDVCHAVVVHFGVKGSHMRSVCLAPDEPRAKLLCEITSAEVSAGWGKPMDGPARVVGIVNVHGAAKMSEAGCMCFNCGAGPH